MGQKTNSNIFRLGIKKNEWNSRYFEKNKEEFTLYNYQNIQIQSYLKQFLSKNGLILQNTKFHFNSANLYIFISYYSTKKSFFLINKSVPNQFIKFNVKKRKKPTKRKTEKIKTNLKLNTFLDYDSQDRKAPNKNYRLKTKRLSILDKYKNFSQRNTYRNNEVLKKNSFLEQLLESLSVFTNKKFHIFLTFQNLNRGLSIKLPQKEQDFLKRKILFLKRYSKNKFFEESLNVILIVTKIKNSSRLLANFLAQQFSVLKRHNHFLIFLKRILTIFIYSKFSKIKGIKIIMSGRFNGAPRAKSRLLTIGNIPIQTISKQIDYHETTSYTKNGTFGVKVWVNQDSK